MKNLAIYVLSIITAVLVFCIVGINNRRAYWMNKANYAEKVINRVIEDNPDYAYDVLSEGDEWNNWVEF